MESPGLLTRHAGVIACALAAGSAVIGALFAAVWGRREPTDTPDALARALRIAATDPTVALRASEPDVKAALQRTTAEATSRGVFGVPTVEVDGEHFWGLDSFPALEAVLRGEDPVTPEFLARLETMPIAAARRRR